MFGNDWYFDRRLIMWRALFLALGISCMIVGAEGLALDSATLKSWVADGKRVINLDTWMPWSLLSAGAIVILYSFTIPKRVRS